MLQLGRFYEIWKHINHYRVCGSLDQPTRSIFQNILWAIGGNNKLRLSLEGNFRLNTMITFISQTLAVSFSQDLLSLYDLAKWCVVIFADKIPKRFYRIIEILPFLQKLFKRSLLLEEFFLTFAGSWPRAILIGTVFGENSELCRFCLTLAGC